jgi:tetratricopeptide (TPR) repeat protein
LLLLLLLLLLLFATAPAVAIMSGAENQRAPSDDADYDAGVAAFDREDWPAVIAEMTKVIERRPWHDNAHSLMGFAYRKLGDYDRSLRFYGKALELNPHNREALEYLGEAYLDLGDTEKAEEVLDRLAAECKRIAVGFTNGDWKSGCEAWQELKAAFEAHLAGKPRADE